MPEMSEEAKKETYTQDVREDLLRGHGKAVRSSALQYYVLTEDGQCAYAGKEATPLGPMERALFARYLQDTRDITNAELFWLTNYLAEPY